MNKREVNLKSSFIRLLKYIGKYKLAIFIVIIMAILSTLFTIAGPKILALVTDELVVGVKNKIRIGKFEINYEYVVKIILLMLILYILSAIISYLQYYIMAKITANIIYRLRSDIINKLQKMPVSYFNENSYGDILSRMSNDVDIVYTSITSGFISIITSVIAIIGVLIMMLSINVIMTIVTLLVLPILGMVVGKVVKISQKYFVSQRKILGDLNGKIEEDFSATYLIKAFNQENQSLESFNEDNDKLFSVNLRSQFLSQLIMPVSVIVTNIGYVIICIISVILAIKNKISIGSIQAFLQYQKSFTQPISILSSISNEIQKTAAASDRIFDLLDEEELKDNITNIDESKIDKDVAIRIKDVDFSYDGSDNYVIHKLNLEAGRKEKVAIVGSTGAGKTTIVKLLMGFYPINNGNIYVNGIDYNNLSRNDLRKNFSFVLQDTWLFNGTIMENIRYGRRDATDDEVINAAKLSKAHHFIKTLPLGYDTMINEDSDNISQGQKQLLTIARAMLRDANILILDEATSSVDTKTEIDIQKAMDALMEDKTSFVIAHRLSTIRNADKILVIEHGDVVEMGNHETLMKKKGRYYEMNQK